MLRSSDGYMKSDDAIEMAISSYVQGYRDAVNVLVKSTEVLSEDEIKKRYYEKLKEAKSDGTP